MGAGLLLVLAARTVSRLTDAGGLSLPLVDAVPVVGGGAGVVVVVVLLRVVLTRRALACRVTVDLLAPEEFDPSSEDVEQLVAALGRVRPRGGWLTRGASAVRFEIVTDAEGLVRYRISAPGRSRPALESALATYPGVELHEPAADPGPVTSRLRRVVRVRLILARSAREALAETGLQPDLIQGLAAAVSQLEPADGEQARVVLDARILSPGQAGRVRRRLLHDRDQRGPLALLQGPGGQGRTTPSETVQRRHDTQGLDRKLAPQHPLMQFQLALRVEARDRHRALETMRSLLGGMDGMSAANHLRARGLRLGGLGFLGDDLPGRRRRFDRRLVDGRFAARRRDLVSAREVQGLLKPPTVHCHADNVARSRGAIPAPPRGLPEYQGQRGVIPLGWVQTRTGRRTVGVRAEETFFAYMAGRSRYGKTETAIGQFVALVRSGHGGLFLDPHADAIAEIKTYLTDPGVRERVVEIDLSDRKTDNNQPGWNLFGLTSRSPIQAAARVDAFVDALAAALGWDERNTRALNLATQSAQALTELALTLPPELAPTIFEVPTLLSDEQWRQAVLPRLSAPTRSFFTDRFPSLPGEAITAVTNLLDRLRASRSVAALLGSPVSTYDARRAMANDWIVLACPGSGSTRDRLIANLLVYDVLHAAKARASMPVSARRPFWVFLDELQTYDGPNLPALLEQSAKYGGRAFLFNQNPERLSQATWNAVSTNRSHLMSTTVNAKAARMIGAEWGTPPAADVLTRLDRYTYLASVTVGTEVARPFLVHGIPAAELHAEHRHPDQLDLLDAAIDETAGRQPVQERLAVVDDHAARIRTHLTKTPPDGGSVAAVPSGPHVIRTGKPGAGS
jgi:hypothetical protein